MKCVFMGDIVTLNAFRPSAAGGVEPFSDGQKQRLLAMGQKLNVDAQIIEINEENVSIIQIAVFINEESHRNLFLVTKTPGKLNADTYVFASSGSPAVQADTIDFENLINLIGNYVTQKLFSRLDRPRTATIHTLFPPP